MATKTFGIKQKISSFLLREDGRVSKKAILKAGFIIGAIALAVKGADAGHGYHNNSVFTGNCPNVNAEKPAPANWGPVNTALHENNLFVKTVFGKMEVGHDHCIETHSNTALIWHKD